MKKYSYLMAALLMMGSSAMAKDVYLSATGSDENDGLTAGNAVATLSKAVELAEDGDVINISGIIPVKWMLALEKNNLNFRGTDAATDGFDGQEQSLIIYAVNKNVQFNNLTIQNCKNPGTVVAGGAFSFAGGNPTFRNCVLTNNEASSSADQGRGGAIYFTNSNLKIYDSEITSNVANKESGALQGRGGTLVLQNTTVSGNTAVGDCGAIHIVDLRQVEIDKCVITDNTAGKSGGALYITGSGVENLKVTRTFIASNKANGDHGGAVYFGLGNNKDKDYQPFLFGACTITGNECKSAGGTMFITGGFDGTKTNLEDGTRKEQVVNIVNCTITDNQTLSNQGNSGGINYQDGTEGKKVAQLNIINTILEGNHSLDDSRFADGWFKNAPVTIKNSIVGHIYEMDKETFIGTVENSQTETTPAGAEATTAGLQALTEEHYYPLTEGTQATTMGVVEDATAAGLTTDQLGNALELPYIGAVQRAEPAGETPTAISDVKLLSPTQNGSYNLNGRRVSQLKKGLVIVDGKKIMVK